MADITNAQKAPILLDGTPPPPEALLSVSNAHVAVADGFVVGQSAGDVTLTAQLAGRTGTLDIHVVDEPIVVTIGTPEPK